MNSLFNATFLNLLIILITNPIQISSSYSSMSIYSALACSHVAYVHTCMWKAWVQCQVFFTTLYLLRGHLWLSLELISSAALEK